METGYGYLIHSNDTKIIKFKNGYLIHHGILGQKWGIRRFQNSDGTLTQEGRSRYRTDKVLNNIGRALTNTSVGQRLAVNLNKGYRTDKKDIKNVYKEKKSQFKSIEDKGKRKERIKTLKSDFKKTKAEARVSAAQANYSWQTKKANTKIQSQSVGKAFLKSLLMTGYGALHYDQLSSANVNKGLSFLGGLGIGALDYGFKGTGQIVDYAMNKHDSNRGKPYRGIDYNKLEKHMDERQKQRQQKKG